MVSVGVRPRAAPVQWLTGIGFIFVGRYEEPRQLSRKESSESSRYGYIAHGQADA